MKESKIFDSNGKVYFGWWATIAGFILIVFGYSCIVSITGVFFLPVTTDLGFSIGQFSIYVTIQCLASVLALFIFQNKMNKKYIRKIMIFGAICGAVSFAGFAAAQELWQFYLLSIPMGFCFSLLTSTPCTVIISNWFGMKLRGLALGILFSPLGAMIMSWLMNIIVQNFGWRIGYLIIGLCLVVICIPCVLVFMKWSPEEKGLVRKGDAEDVPVNQEDVTGATFKRAIKRPSTWIVLLSAASITIASGTLLSHTMPFLELGGLSNTLASSVFSLMFGALTIGQIVVGAYCDRFKLSGGAVTVSIIFAIAFIATIAIPHYPWLVIVLILGYGFGCPAVNVISPLVMNHMFGEKEIGKFISYLNIFIAVGVAFGSSIVGLIYDLTGSYTPAFILMACFLLISAVLRGIFCSDKFFYKNRISEEELHEKIS
ncbi:MFS transporter [Anaerovorax odorimutans]|uniref:MFS transporter n=1 Tax=Anaerovorax odorimutans TaxID=109327 RepID=A0ABT1RJ21_9FIRM|nr:MFS transporter [Anaerovorax odorimutans]MCQ4635189.1 MFS transporter [Anaerovorax odorimutans]